MLNHMFFFFFFGHWEFKSARSDSRPCDMSLAPQAPGGGALCVLKKVNYSKISIKQCFLLWNITKTSSSRWCRVNETGPGLPNREGNEMDCHYFQMEKESKWTDGCKPSTRWKLFDFHQNNNNNKRSIVWHYFFYERFFLMELRIFSDEVKCRMDSPFLVRKVWDKIRNTSSIY